MPPQQIPMQLPQPGPVMAPQLPQPQQPQFIPVLQVLFQYISF